MDTLALLRFHQLFDSAFPTGAFAYSGGLETYAQRGLSHDGLRELIGNNLALGYGRLDLAAAALAHERFGDGDALDDLAWRVDAAKVIEGPRNASLQMGRRLCDLAERLQSRAGLYGDRPHYCVVVGYASATFGVPKRDTVTGLGQSLVMGSLAAASRCMRLGATRAQTMLSELQPSIAEAVDVALSDPEGSMFTCTPGLDLRAHEQASLYTRLFQS